MKNVMSLGPGSMLAQPARIIAPMAVSRALLIVFSIMVSSLVGLPAMPHGHRRQQ
jgi:hypothetical protein